MGTQRLLGVPASSAPGTLPTGCTQGLEPTDDLAVDVVTGVAPDQRIDMAPLVPQQPPPCSLRTPALDDGLRMGWGADLVPF